MRASFFSYHREGMDNFTEKPDLVRENIADALIKLLDVYNQRPKSYLIQLFFDSKTDEIVSIFSRGPKVEFDLTLSILKKISPFFNSKWKQIKM